MESPLDSDDFSPVTEQEIKSEIDEDHQQVENNHLDLVDCSVKILNKGQKKNLQESMNVVDQEDYAMWTTLRKSKKQLRQSHRMLPRGCKSFVLELFAGTATLTYLAASIGLRVSEPVDLMMCGPCRDLLGRRRRREIAAQVEQDDPFPPAISPVWGPWSTMQAINVAKDPNFAEKLAFQRKSWYPVIQWLTGLVKQRLSKGREVLFEQPWPSAMWKLKCMEDLMSLELENAITGEPLERIRLDQCMYGLQDRDSGLPHKKPTGLLLSSSRMKLRLSDLCDGRHEHEPLEGGSRILVGLRIGRSNFVKRCSLERIRRWLLRS